MTNGYVPPGAPPDVKRVVRSFYGAVNTKLNESEFAAYATFLNWGYASTEAPEAATVALPERMLNRNAVKLVLELVGDCDLTGRDVLEVGCGRGGNLATIGRYFRPRSLAGVDLTGPSVAFCQRTLGDQRHWFLQADAEALPFQSGAFDVVLSVESSNAYPNMQAFYRQVARVLRPGGTFLYTDLLRVRLMGGYLDDLAALGFAIEVSRDITANALRSRDELATTQLRAFDKLDKLDEHGAARFDSPHEADIFQFFLAPRGSRLYQQVQAGQFCYYLYRLRKVSEALPQAEHRP